MKKKDKNLKWYLMGEFLGKTSVICTEVLIITAVLGVACDLIWDVKERRQQARVVTNKNNNK